MLPVYRSLHSLLLLTALAGVISLSGCSKPPANAADAAAPAAKTAAPADKAPAGADKASADRADSDQEAADKRVKLSAADAAKMGIVVAEATEAQFTPETEGYAIIVSHDAIAQAVADAGTAEANSKQSQAVLARIERLAGTAGAETAEARETAQRQAAADQIAAALAQRKLSSLLGQHSSVVLGHDTLLQEVAAGQTKVARVTFALGALKTTPRSLRLARLDAPTAPEQWHSHTIWNAPADATMPGRSFFALLPDAAVEEGERLSAWAPGAEGGVQSGAWIPGAAAVAEGGRYWCYVRHEAGTFDRRPLDISHPLRDGYFVDDLKPGDAVVTRGGGLLLARELNPDTEAGD
jgi:hypothetical protein